MCADPLTNYRASGQPSQPERRRLLRRGLWLEYTTLSWNVIGVVVLAVTAITAGSVALAGFGVDSLIEILASTVVVWQLRGTDAPSRTQSALRVIAVAFALLAVYLTVQSAATLISADHPHRSLVGAVWLGVTALVMFALAHAKADTGQQLHNRVLQTEARITVIDGMLAVAVLIGVLLNAVAGWWWADPISALVLVLYSVREARHAWKEAEEAKQQNAWQSPQVRGSRPSPPTGPLSDSDGT